MGYRILLLDENEAHARALEQACGIDGHELVHLKSVQAAMEWLNKRDHTDVIVSAVHLENESVFDFLKAIKSDPRHNWIQFVMVCTAPSELAMFLNDQVEQAAQLLGANKYVMMDEFDPHRLLHEIKAAFPHQLPQKDQDPIKDQQGIPRPLEEVQRGRTENRVEPLKDFETS